MPARPKMLLAALALLGTPGCLDTHSGLRTRTDPSVMARSKATADEETRYGCRKVSIGALPRPTFYGYLRTRALARGEPGGPTEADAPPREVRWLYDTSWNLVGCVSPNGATVRFDTHQRSESLGNMQLDDALRAVFDVRTRDDVHYTKLPAPRE